MFKHIRRERTPALAAGLAAAILASAIPAAAAERGNAEGGRQLVTTVCVACHTVPSASVGSDAAPPLAQVARQNRGNAAWLRLWLTDPHPPMRGINLTRRQIEDVIAYLESLPAE